MADSSLVVMASLCVSVIVQHSNQSGKTHDDTYLSFDFPARLQARELSCGIFDGLCGSEQLVFGDKSGVRGVNPIVVLELLSSGRQIRDALGDPARNVAQLLLVVRVRLVQAVHDHLQQLAILHGNLAARVQRLASHFLLV